ncbi:Uncharacterized protein FKW44_005766, partial [Caligus rogercresseyi]
TPTEIAFALNVSRPTVYDVKNALVADRDLERKPDSDRKPMFNCKNVKTAVEAEPTKSMAAHAKDMGVSTNTIVRMIIIIWVPEGNVVSFCMLLKGSIFHVFSSLKMMTRLAGADLRSLQRRRWTAIILGVSRGLFFNSKDFPPLLR